MAYRDLGKVFPIGAGFSVERVSLVPGSILGNSEPQRAKDETSSFSLFSGA